MSEPAITRKFIRSLIIAVLSMYLVVWMWLDAENDLKQARTVILEHQLCREDEACWDCTTMGNRVCGDTRGGAR